MRLFWLAIGCAALLLGSLLAALSRQAGQRSDGDWQRIDAFARAVAQRLDAGARPHATLVPLASAGEAWAHYGAAARWAALDLEPESAVELAPVVAALQQRMALDELHTGAASPVCAPPTLAALEHKDAGFDAMAVLRLAQCAGAELAAAQRTGDGERAVASTATLLTLLRDLEAMGVLLPELMAADALARTARGWQTEALARLSPAAAARLQAVLQQFDDGWSPELRGLWSQAWLAVAAAERGIARGMHPAWWRLLGSPRAQFGADLADVLGDLTRLESVAGRSWAERRVELAAITATARSERGTLRSRLAIDLVQFEQQKRSATAELRQLRLRLAQRLGGELQLLDPMGDGPLRLAATIGK